MAYYGQQRKMQEGTFTQTIYGLIRDQKFSEAIAHLNVELQVLFLLLLLFYAGGSPHCVALIHAELAGQPGRSVAHGLLLLLQRPVRDFLADVRDEPHLMQISAACVSMLMHRTLFFLFASALLFPLLLCLFLF